MTEHQSMLQAETEMVLATDIKRIASLVRGHVMVWALNGNSAEAAMTTTKPSETVEDLPHRHVSMQVGTIPTDTGASLIPKVRIAFAFPLNARLELFLQDEAATPIEAGMCAAERWSCE